MSKKTKMMHDLRLRGRLYRLPDDSETSGHWTYFIRIGEENPAQTFHCPDCFVKEADAFEEMTKQIETVMQQIKKSIPGTLFSINSWAAPSS